MNLTYADLKAAMRSMMRCAPQPQSGLFGLLHSSRLVGRAEVFNEGSPSPKSRQPQTILGMKVITSPFIPDEVPKIQVRDITLSDGTRLLSPEFQARENAWWLETFGTKQVAFILDDRQAIAWSSGMKARIEREIERTVFGGAASHK